MHEKVRAFLDAKKKEEQRNYELEKQKTLISLGLYDIEYAPDNKYSPVYPNVEWDDENITNKYYREVPIEVTDEVYAEIKKYARKKKAASMPAGSNSVATMLTAIAWIIFLAGFIAGIALAIETKEVYDHYNYHTEMKATFSFATAFTYWAISLISGVMFLGFAEIIKLLDAIKRK